MKIIEEKKIGFEKNYFENIEINVVFFYSPHSAMGSHVGVQVGWVAESLVADGALVWRC